MIIIHKLKTEKCYVKMWFTLTEFNHDVQPVSTIIASLMNFNDCKPTEPYDFAVVTYEKLLAVRKSNIDDNTDTNDFAFEFDPNDQGNEFKIISFPAGMSSNRHLL